MRTRVGAGSRDDRTTRNVYDEAGRLLWSVNAEGGATEYHYDNDGNVVSQTEHSRRISTTSLAGRWSRRTSPRGSRSTRPTIARR